MSKYTTEVRYICEHYAGLDESAGYDEVDKIVEAAAPYIFENYPIFDGDYRLALNKKILRHYYTREICAETVGLWKLWLNNKMNEIMPLYNELYKTTVLEFNPLYDVDYKREYEGKDGGSTQRGTASQSTRTASGSTTDEQKSRYSDTPQGGITGLANDTYLTNATLNNGTTTTSDTTQEGRSDQEASTFANTNEYAEHVFGKQGGTSYAKTIMELREALINIDQMIIDELKDLFFKLY